MEGGRIGSPKSKGLLATGRKMEAFRLELGLPG